MDFAILPSMKSTPTSIFESTGAVLGAFAGDWRQINAAAGRNADLLVLALAPPVLAAFAVTAVGRWAIGEIRRQVRIHEKRPASPSLRGTPTPAEIAEEWAREPRTPAVCLRIGSRLADLDPTLDHTLLRKKDARGRLVIRARKGGMKGWLSDHRVPVAYSTVMRYKKLAQRLRQVLRLDERLPLEWLLDGVPSGQTLPSPLAAQCSAAARGLSALLRVNPTLKALTLAVEKKLGIVRLVSVRRVGSGRRSTASDKRKKQCFSIISQGRRATVQPDRAEATKTAILRILKARNLSGRALHLQNRLKAWLSRLPAPPASGG